MQGGVCVADKAVQTHRKDQTCSPQEVRNKGKVFTIRPLQEGDYHKGFLRLLSQLTTTGEVTEQLFKQRYQLIHAKEDYHIIIICHEDQVVGTATLVIEYKFIHQCSQVGHIEDVVVDQSYRGYRLGYYLMEYLTNVAKQYQCYKLVLDCTIQNIPFYEKCGYQKKEVQMVQYIPQSKL